MPSPAGNCCSPLCVRAESSILEFFDKPLILIDEPEMTEAAAERLWTRLREPAQASAIDPETAHARLG